MKPKRSRKSVALSMAAAFAVGICAALAWTYGGLGDGAKNANSATQNPNPMSREAAPSREPMQSPEPRAPADYTLESNELIELRAVDFPRDRPVVLALTLPVAATRLSEFGVTIADESGRRHDAKATIQGAARLRADLELESTWLSPGTYLIYLKTDEPSHNPLRRYPLIVH